MATLFSSSLLNYNPSSKTQNYTKLHFHYPSTLSLSSFHLKPAFFSLSKPPLNRCVPKAVPEYDFVAEEDAITIDNLMRFIELSLGTWFGSFHQFDPEGSLLHTISTKLAASSYGDGDLISLIQTLYIKQPQSTTSVSGDTYEQEWAEYKIKETNMYTVDKYQQVGFFPNQRAFALRYQTAGMLEHIIRQGVLGEDDIGEESPKNLILPSRRPSLVCENCLYSLERDMRVRAFHIMDPSGVIQMFLIFLEERGGNLLSHPSLSDSEKITSRIIPHLGTWKGHSITKRSGVYGATLAEADTLSVLEMDNEGKMIQIYAITLSRSAHLLLSFYKDHTSTSKESNITTNVHWTGTITNNLVKFEGGYQITLLPGGMYMGCPSNVGKSVADSKSFHLELCWVESLGKRQRLVRTYDVEGLAVSSTYFFETKV